MRVKPIVTGIMAATAALALAGCGPRGAISDACMAGGRSAANLHLCSCVQGVANQTLSGSDQRRAAGFFTEPDKAQQTRASSSTGDRAFWGRYRDFTNTASSRCG
ncbi:Arginine/ornithine transport system ATPase [Ketogulonicigenium robustum]|uniref:Arginine/ornithine transport system ATPase n=1 Tax=Ketogulonicigenium robustum TaxID=92947 RepID=A0A1W6P160_9RHOB|nr:arginine transporter [Ketogulonicigenium robustum]ARO15131.1 Arginine/ornithine transport system ATPase [Ketogulonicigenium robustum]